MLSKAHLTSHSKMSFSRWVIRPSWLSGSWRSFLYSSVYSCHFFLISSASVKSTPFLLLVVLRWFSGKKISCLCRRHRICKVLSQSLDPWSFVVENGNTLQYSCLENSMNSGTWWATTNSISKNQTQMSDWACWPKLILLFLWYRIWWNGTYIF